MSRNTPQFLRQPRPEMPHRLFRDSQVGTRRLGARSLGQTTHWFLIRLQPRLRAPKLCVPRLTPISELIPRGFIWTVFKKLIVEYGQQTIPGRNRRR